MFSFRFLAAFGSSADAWAMTTILIPFQAGGMDLILSGSAATGWYQVLAEDGNGYAPLEEGSVRLTATGFTLTDAAVVDLGGQLRVYSASQFGIGVQCHTISADGALRRVAPLNQVGPVEMKVSTIEALELDGVQYLATASHDRNTISLIQVASGSAPVFVAQLTDSEKATLEGVSDMVSLTVDDQLILVAASREGNGLSSFQIETGGQITLVDAITPRDGLWVNGLDVLSAIEVGGTSFVIAGSAATGSLSVIRVNALGVMFITDQLLDDLSTRFANVTQIETATVYGRGFVLAAGGDGGLALLELLPDGRLMHHVSLEARDEWSVFAGGVSGLLMMAQGDTALGILAAGAGGVAQFTVDLGDLGPLVRGTSRAETLTGTGADDLIFGAGGADTLNGGAGDDLLIAPVAGSRFIGGAGADIFTPGAGSATSIIADFEHGVDRIDLGDWGRLYWVGALSIESRSYGAEIRFGSNVLQVHSADGGNLDPLTWTQDDFLF